MKILHFADLHIGHENYGKIDERSGLNTRLLDFLKAFDFIVNYALSHQIDLVIFAGDAYKTRDPSPTYQREFGRRLKKIAEKIPVVLITGNHDIPPSFGKADTLEIFPILAVPNVYVFSKPTVSVIPVTRNQTPVTIAALPWLSRSMLLKENERKKSIDETRKILSQRLDETFSNLVSKIKIDKPAIAICHQSVTEAVFGANQDTYAGSDPLLSLEVLKNKKLSYVALGHLHKFQVLAENPPIIYPGSPERLDFGEEQDEKGFIVAEINEKKLKKTKWHFVILPARKFITLNIEINKEKKNPSQYVVDEIKKAKIKNAIVRINIRGEDSVLVKILESDLKKATSTAYFVASISKKSEKKIIKLEIEKEHLVPIDWLKKFMEMKKFDQKEQNKLNEAAEELIEELDG